MSSISLGGGTLSFPALALDAGQSQVEGAGRSLQESGDDEPVPLVGSAAGGGTLLLPPEEKRSTSWVIPPIRWLGSVGYTYRQNSNNSGLRASDQLVTSNIRGSSYIYAPWFATVSGDLGVITGGNRIQSGEGGGGSSQNRHLSFVGGGNLDLFPASRFPFNGSFSVSDSRVSGTSVSSEYSETRLGLRQSYRTEDGQQSLAASFDHSTVNSENGQRDTVDALGANFTVPIGAFSNALSSRVSVSERGSTGEGATLFSANSSHFFRSDENNFTFDAYSNFTDNNLRLRSGNSLSESRGQFLQLNSSASWRPEFEDRDDLPLALTGGLMYFGAKSGAATFSSQTQRISGTASAYYRFTGNLSATGSGTLNYFTTNGGQPRMVNLLTSSVAYAGDPLTFGNYSYSWNSGAGASWQGASGDASSNMLTSVQLGHSLGRNLIISPTDSISITFSQNATAYQNDIAGNATTLSSSATGSYRLSLGEQFSGNMNATLSDIMTNGVNAQHYRSLNVGLNGLGQLSPRSSANVNLSFNWSDQTVQAAVDSLGQQTSSQRMGLAGSASYSHMRFAGVPGLRYNILFTANTLLRDDRLLGDVNGKAEKTRYSLENRLDTRIGMLDLRLAATMNDVGGKKNALLFFQATRRFGAY